MFIQGPAILIRGVLTRERAGGWPAAFFFVRLCASVMWSRRRRPEPEYTLAA